MKIVLLTLAVAGVGIYVTVGRQEANDGRDKALEMANAWASGDLRTIASAQSLFRESDRERDDLIDYGSLSELGRVDLIDEVLASGTKRGYTFACWASPATPEFLWMATARPAEPREGLRSFAINQAGEVFFTTSGVAALNTACAIPSGWLPWKP